MKDLVPRLYYSYSQYVNKEKMIPSAIDGLIPVHRRLLLTLHLVAANKKVKTARVLGDLMGKFHPHELAITPATWCVQNNLAIGSGNWGDPYGIEPEPAAAPRYTSMRANPFIEKIAFSLVDYVKWEESDLDPEPKVLPSMVPLCFIGVRDMSHMAFGFRTAFPVYNFEDLIKRLQGLLGVTKRNPTIVPKMHNCDILADKTVLNNLLSKPGKHLIEMKGKYDVDHSTNEIHIYGWPPRDNMKGISFQSIFNDINKYKKIKFFDNNLVGYIDNSDKDNPNKITLRLLKQRNIGTLFTDLVEAVDKSLTVKVGYNIIVVNEEKQDTPFYSCVDEMLLNAHNFRKSILELFFKSEISRVENKILECHIIKALRENIKDIVDSCKYNVDKIVEYMVKKFKFNEADVRRVMGRYSIAAMLNNQQPEIDDLKKEKSNLVNNLTNIDEYMISEYKGIC